MPEHTYSTVRFFRFFSLLLFVAKELTLCFKLWFSNPNIFGTQCRKPLIFQTYIFWSNKSHSLKFQRFMTLESKDIGIRKSEFVAKSQFLSKEFSLSHKLWFSNSYNFVNQCCIFQTMNSVSSNNLSLNIKSVHYQVAQI